MRPAFLLLLPLLLAAMLPASCKHPLPLPPAGDTLIYVMAGQSNMAGRGAVTSSDSAVNARILELTENEHFVPKRGANTVFQGGLAGHDCGRAFGEALLPHLRAGECIALVQCSVSSTTIGEWAGDSLHSVRLYSTMLARTRAAMRSGNLKGVLWMQGESDAAEPDAGAWYSARLEAFIRRYRGEAGIGAVPFFVALLPHWCRRTYRHEVDSCIRDVATRIPAVYLVHTDDLMPKGDSVHLDASGQRGLGQRFADAALLLL